METTCGGPASTTTLGTFNGATDIRPWKLLVFSESEEAHRPSMEPRTFDRGNPLHPLPHGLAGEVPSMEPRPFDRGNEGPDDFRCKKCHLQWSHGHSTVETRSLRPPGEPVTTFNGATAIRPWKHRPARPCGWRQTAFNGATAIRPWKQRSSMFSQPAPSSLQWSHGHSTVETFQGDWGCRSRLVPSMEPRPFDRGNEGSRQSVASGRPAGSTFNGATAIRPWKQLRTAHPQREACSFNGATAIRPWKLLPTSMSGPRWSPFNGATAIRPWKLPDHSGHRVL